MTKPRKAHDVAPSESLHFGAAPSLRPPPALATEAGRARIDRWGEAQLRAVVDHLPIGVVLVEGELVSFNAAVCELTGYDHSDISTLHQWFTCLYAGRALDVRALYLNDRAQGFPQSRVVTIQRRDGELREVGFTGYRADDGEYWFLQDHSEAIAARWRLQETADQLRAILKTLPDTVLIFAASGIVLEAQLVAAHSRVFGLGDTDVQGRDVTEFVGQRQARQLRRAFANVLATGENQILKGTLSSLHAGTRMIEAHLCRLDESRVLALFRDVSEAHEASQRLNFLAYHDPLTELANRRRFAELLQARIESERGQGRGQLVLLFADLDRFKLINDSFGHQCGDFVLRETARRIRQCLDEDDVAARYGGDEFLVLLRRPLPPEQVQQLAERILSAVAAPLDWQGNLVWVTASVGIVPFDPDHGSADAYLSDADAAMYRAKAIGRNKVVLFDQRMRLEAAQHMRLEAELRLAIDAEQLELCYQPIISLRDGRVEGFEALCRWRHPVAGLLPASMFIPLAEETGLVVPLGNLLLRQVCAALADWEARGGPLATLPVHLNISFRQFAHVGFVARVRKTLDTFHLRPDRLRLEMTETALMADTELAHRVLAELADLGVAVVLDDFGAGYSSLSYLYEFPFEAIKIDRGFASGLGHSARAEVLLRAVLTLAANLALHCTLEGVETEAQLEIVRAMDCPSVQGFLYGQGVRGDELIDAVDADGYWRRPGA